MSNPFADQLLKAGAVSKDRARKVSKSKQHQARLARSGQAEADTTSDEVARIAAAKRERDRALNAERQQAQEQREKLAQARQIVQQHAVPRESGETPYRFSLDNATKEIMLSPAQRQAVIHGRLGIAQGSDGYALLPCASIEKLRLRAPELVLLLHEADHSDEHAGLDAADDPYADYVIPDDLVW